MSAIVATRGVTLFPEEIRTALFISTPFNCNAPLYLLMESPEMVTSISSPMLKVLLELNRTIIPFGSGVELSCSMIFFPVMLPLFLSEITIPLILTHCGAMVPGAVTNDFRTLSMVINDGLVQQELCICTW